MAFDEKQALELLAQILEAKIKEEFEIKFLSGNLKNTMVIENLGTEIKIKIPAEKYNMLQFQKKGVVIHTGTGSYASKLDVEGSSFMVYPNYVKKGSYKVKPHNHINFIENVIQLAIQEWQGLITAGGGVTVQGVTYTY